MLTLDVELHQAKETKPSIHSTLLASIMLPVSIAILVTASLLRWVDAVIARETSHLRFEAFVAAYGKLYIPGSVEHQLRKSLFAARWSQIREQNSKTNRRWTAGVSAFTDRTDEELAQLRGWRQVDHVTRQGPAALLQERAHARHQIPAEVNWQSLSFAAHVPDQRECGSCWAVATVTMLQGRLEAQAQRNRTFSAQQLVDCVPNPSGCGGSGGCDGATVELAMHYVAEVGLEDETTTPYTARQSTCKRPADSDSTLASSSSKSFSDSNLRGRGGLSVGLKTWSKLPENKALPLMHAVSNGPVAISVAASNWFLYSYGIFDSCGKDVVIDHAVVLFGYGTSPEGLKFWTLRNSWGKAWGEDGFIRILRHNTHEEDDQYCGIDHDPKNGVSCRPYPKEVVVCGMCGLLYDSVVADF